MFPSSTSLQHPSSQIVAPDCGSPLRAASTPQPRQDWSHPNHQGSPDYSWHTQRAQQTLDCAHDVIGPSVPPDLLVVSETEAGQELGGWFPGPSPSCRSRPDPQMLQKNAGRAPSSPSCLYPAPSPARPRAACQQVNRRGVWEGRTHSSLALQGWKGREWSGPSTAFPLGHCFSPVPASK